MVRWGREGVYLGLGILVAGGVEGRWDHGNTVAGRTRLVDVDIDSYPLELHTGFVLVHHYNHCQVERGNIILKTH